MESIERLPEHPLTKVTRHCQTSRPRAAVIGAGMAGLICARTLQDQGIEVMVFEKSRGPGGRAATRRSDTGLSFDHGAQYFTTRDPLFGRYVEAWAEQGIVAEWAGRIVQLNGKDVTPKTDQPRRYVGVPDMTAMARQLAADLPLRSEVRIVQLSRIGLAWELTDAAGQKYGPFEYVVVSLPAPQAADLLGEHALASEARAVRMTPCWAVLAAFEQPVETGWDGAFVHGAPLAWVARNSSKPGRDCVADCWVLQATADWSASHQDCNRGDVVKLLLGEFGTITSAPLPPAVYHDSHLWRCSASPQPLDRLFLFEPNTGLALCGDWLAGGRIEGAFRSGVAAAECILRQVGLPFSPLIPSSAATH